MAGDRGPLDVWAALDPTGVSSRAVRLARRLPVVALLESAVLAPVERRVLGELADRVDEVTGRPSTAAGAVELAALEAAGGAPATSASPGELLDRLLRTSMDLTPAQSGQQQFTLILQRLVPDEARILAALADGSAYALLHVAAGGLPGAHTQRVLENVSNVGRVAGVALPARVPGYVTHLRALGLAEAGPGDGSLDTEYDILTTDRAVMDAREEADALSRFPARMVRRTLHMSALGRDLWEACRPSPTPPASAPRSPS